MNWIRHITALMLCVAWAGARAADSEAATPPVPPAISSSNFLETVVALAIVLMLIFGLTFVVRRFGRIPGMGKGQVQVLGGVSVGTRERAVLVSVEGQRLLLGVAPGRVQTLYVLPQQAADKSFESELATAKGDAEA